MFVQNLFHLKSIDDLKKYFVYVLEILRPLPSTICLQGSRSTHCIQLHLHHEGNKPNVSFKFKGDNFQSWSDS